MHVPLNPHLNNLTCCFHICLVMNREHLANANGEIALAYVEHLAPAPGGTAAYVALSCHHCGRVPRSLGVAICIGDTILSPSYVAYIAPAPGGTLLFPPLPPVGMAGSALPPMAIAASTQ